MKIYPVFSSSIPKITFECDRKDAASDFSRKAYLNLFIAGKFNSPADFESQLLFEYDNNNKISIKILNKNLALGDVMSVMLGKATDLRDHKLKYTAKEVLHLFLDVSSRKYDFQAKGDIQIVYYWNGTDDFKDELDKISANNPKRLLNENIMVQPDDDHFASKAVEELQRSLETARLCAEYGTEPANKAASILQGAFFARKTNKNIAAQNEIKKIVIELLNKNKFLDATKILTYMNNNVKEPLHKANYESALKVAKNVLNPPPSVYRGP